MLRDCIPYQDLRGKPGETKASGAGAGWGKPAPRKVCCGGTFSKLLASALNKEALQKSAVVPSSWVATCQHGTPPLPRSAALSCERIETDPPPSPPSHATSLL